MFALGPKGDWGGPDLLEGWMHGDDYIPGGGGQAWPARTRMTFLLFLYMFPSLFPLYFTRRLWAPGEGGRL